jgi:hypothetical protein|tara:strand:+ start:400 stop:576 length:177 start_codon:yes stop_codon:yes gene_type:complete
MKEIIKRYKKAIDDEDWYTIEKIQKEIKKYERLYNKTISQISSNHRGPESSSKSVSGY